VQNSLYKTIRFLDSRTGNKAIGIVDIGLFKNAEANLAPKKPLEDQLAAVISALTDSTAGDGELLFQLHRLRFTEKIGTRYFYLIADLYARSGKVYKRLANIDTVLLFRFEYWNELVYEESKIITGFIAHNLLKESKDSVTYNIADVEHIDSIDKRSIPVFNAENYTDGLYKNWQSFKAQVPDVPAIVKADKDGSISSVRVIDSTGEKVKVHSKDVYALVYRGQTYIATPFGYYILLKSTDNNFYFTGDIKIAASRGEMGGGFDAFRAMGGLGFGIVGAVLATAANQETYLVMIDYRIGRFIHLQRVIKADE
jgi:hypothetical protein